MTGASSGIGLEVARLLAKQRNYVFISARSEDKLESLREAFPENISVIPLDLSCSVSIAAAESRIKRHTDYIDTLIACAGVCEYDEGLHLSSSMFERITRINYLGVVETVRIALPLLRGSKNSPHIVGVGSLCSIVPFPRAAAYGASKAALDYFLQSLKVDLVDEKIDVSIVRPGFVDTPLTQKNDFDMVFLMSSKAAAERVVGSLSARKLFFDFPLKLAIPLKIMRFLSWFWINYIAKKFRRAEML